MGAFRGSYWVNQGEESSSKDLYSIIAKHIYGRSGKWQLPSKLKWDFEIIQCTVGISLELWSEISRINSIIEFNWLPKFLDICPTPVELTLSVPFHATITYPCFLLQRSNSVISKVGERLVCNAMGNHMWAVFSNASCDVAARAICSPITEVIASRGSTLTTRENCGSHIGIEDCAYFQFHRKLGSLLIFWIPLGTALLNIQTNTVERTNEECQPQLVSSK